MKYQSLFSKTICMKYQSLFSLKNKKKYHKSVSSAELAQRVVNVKSIFYISKVHHAGIMKY